MTQTRITWTYIFNVDTTSLTEPEYIDVGIHRFKPRLQNTFLVNNQILAIWEPGLSIGHTPAFMADMFLSNVLSFRMRGELEAANYYQELYHAAKNEFPINYKGFSG